MKVSDAMTSGAETVRPDATLQEAAETMRRLDIGPLPVCDGTKVLGVLTDRDITVRATAEGRDPFTTLVRDVMTSDVLYVYEDQHLEEATRVMEQNQVRRLIVLDREKNLAGILSLGDVALAGEDEEMKADMLEAVSQPGGPAR